MKLVCQLTLIKPEEFISIPNRGRKFKYICSCGTYVFKTKSDVISGRVNSCGCLKRKLLSNRNFKHGDSTRNDETRLYRIWKGMKSRTYGCSKDNMYYKDRNITICKDWMDFLKFKKWAETNNYNDNLTIDRINVDSNYEPNNCRWIISSEQKQNMSLRSDNTSGKTGVYKIDGKFLALIHKNGKRIRIGVYETFNEAKDARLNEEKKLFINKGKYF